MENESLPQQPRLTREKAAEIFLQNYAFVRTIAYRKAPARHLQDDIAHDAYIDFVEKAEQWEYDPGKVKSLLKRITEIIALRYWQKYIKDLPEKLRKAAEIIWKESYEESFLQKTQLEEQILALELCLQKLSPHHRELLEMYYFENIPYSELSSKMEKKPENLCMIMSRIRAILHDCIEKTLKVEVPDE
ncbi:MAG: sigma-70 family RNA polymerase sigma factor [Planctomycetia bacterium]|nr:sigma-70 family RNA polymerase sigma factor [Planctomycetia bacterium]